MLRLLLQYFVHLRARHRHWTGGSYKCNFCDGSFTLKDSLQKHLTFVGGCAAKNIRNLMDNPNRKPNAAEIVYKTGVNFNMIKMAHHDLKDMVQCFKCPNTRLVTKQKKNCRFKT